MHRDKIEIYGQSVIQHGTFNDRIYLMKFSPDDFPGIMDHIDDLAEKHGYSKVFAKIPETVFPAFLMRGFEMEAYIPGYYSKGYDAIFASFFPGRKRREVESEAVDALAGMMKDVRSSRTAPLEEGYTFRDLEPSDAEELATLYGSVFPSYPFPIHDPAYIAGTMETHFRYFGIIDSEDRLVAASSSEMDRDNAAAEMTDFAVAPPCRGKGFARVLLQKMEEEMTKKGITTFFTIARLNSLPMNLTFLKLGYHYSGTLVKNTNISGRIESMNVLYKKPTSV